MAWKYKGGSNAGIDSIGAGIQVAQKQKQENRLSTDKNRQAIENNNLRNIAKQSSQWKQITGAGSLGADGDWGKRQNEYWAGQIKNYAEITEMMNRGEKVDEGTLALAQIDKKLTDYVNFVQLSNGLKDRTVEAGEFEAGSVGAIVSDGSINDVPATLLNRDMWSNPTGINLQDDEFGNLTLTRGSEKINIVEFNDALQDGRDLLVTIQDPSDLQTTAMTGVLDSLDNKGKITSSYSGDGFSSKKSYYNMPSIESAFRTKNPFKSLTTNPETAAGYWELLGDEINGGEAWVGTEEQKQRFTEAWNKKTIDKLIPQDQRSSAMKATVTSYTKEEEKGEKGDAGDDLDFDGVNYNELIDINNKAVNLVEPEFDDKDLTNPSQVLKNTAAGAKFDSKKKSLLSQTESWLKKNLNLKELDGIPMSGFIVEYVDEENPNKGMRFIPRFDEEIEVPLGKNPDTGKFTLEPGDEGYDDSEKSDKDKVKVVAGKGRAEFNEGFDIGNDLKTFVNYLKKETAKVTGSDDPLGII
jgi:hypothetical protein